MQPHSEGMPALKQVVVSILAATTYAAVAAAAVTTGISASGVVHAASPLDRRDQLSLFENLFTLSAVNYVTVEGVRTGGGASRSLLHGCHGRGRKKWYASVLTGISLPPSMHRLGHLHMFKCCQCVPFSSDGLMMAQVDKACVMYIIEYAGTVTSSN